MNLNELHRILKDCTVSLRKGQVVEEKDISPNIQVTEVWAMPHETDPAFNDYEKIDVGLFTIAINRQAASDNKEDLIKVMMGYPNRERLLQGPSYIEIGAEIDSQEAAFRLAALGQYLGICDNMSPIMLGLDGEAAMDMIRNGFFFIRWMA